ncbi:cytoplasmic protein [Candidatus Dependentiae bacterium]|nr:MAG: cytoplasmic protein [Candidatus Dependentiae bacterium]
MKPKLNKHISPDDFISHYWLKRELLNFCRKRSIPQQGSKQELTKRIEQFLITGTIKTTHKAPQKSSGFDLNHLTRNTRITHDMKLGTHLRVFFMKEIGPQFHFNKTIREFIKHQQGKTLGDAIAAWYQNAKKPKKLTSIEPQFEYNRHIRDYFKKHPGTKLSDAILEWKKNKKMKR